jgi:signal transduction histidine kinase
LTLQDDGKLIGYLVLNGETPLEKPAENFLKEMRFALWFGITIAFAAALLAAGLLTRGITSPIRNLTQAAEAISAGRLDSRATTTGRGEITQLATSFNTMAHTLQQAQKNREVQTADIAHELRNPLAILQGTLEALADGVYEPTPENIEPALDQVRTLNRLVEDLRILALADAGELQLDRQSFILGEFLQRAADAHRERFVAQSINLVVNESAATVRVDADYDRLTQVINNILGNALRYIPTGGMVRITSKLVSEGVIVSVIDNGPGVQSADLPHLFDRFWRGEPSRSRETGGSGLGLTIAHRIIQAHQGRIWAEQTQGGGLTIHFLLPVAR